MKNRHFKDSRLGKVFLQLASVVLAVVLWIYVYNSGAISVTKKVRVHYVLPSHYSLAVPLPEFLEVQYRGPRALLYRIVSQDFPEIKIRFNTPLYIGKKNFEFEFHHDHFASTSTIEIDKIFPSKVNVQLTKKETKIVPLVAKFTGRQSELHISDVKIFPSEVYAEGPRDALDKALKIEVGPLDINDFLHEAKKTTALKVSDQRVRIYYDKNGKHEVQNAIISAKVHAKKANIVFKNIKIQFPEEFSRRDIAKIKDRSATIYVYVPANYSNKLKRDDIEVYASISKVQGKKTFLKLFAKGKEKLHVLQIYPQNIVLENK